MQTPPGSITGPCTPHNLAHRPPPPPPTPLPTRTAEAKEAGSPRRSRTVLRAGSSSKRTGRLHSSRGTSRTRRKARAGPLRPHRAPERDGNPSDDGDLRRPRGRPMRRCGSVSLGRMPLCLASSLGLPWLFGAFGLLVQAPQFWFEVKSNNLGAARASSRSRRTQF